MIVDRDHRETSAVTRQAEGQGEGQTKGEDRVREESR
jgi:hypothetical protein